MEKIIVTLWITFGLYMMMCDNSFANCLPVSSIIGGNVSRATSRWASTRSTVNTAWFFHPMGFSSVNTFVNLYSTHPVTPIPLQ